MSEGKGHGGFQVILGRTPLGRRLAMVAGDAIVITISGKRHTEVVVEQGVDLGVPVLRCPNAGGDSKKLLDIYKARIASGFDAEALDQCLKKIFRSIREDVKNAAAGVAELIKTAKIGKCLVLIPYDPDHEKLYSSTIEPATAKYMFRGNGNSYITIIRKSYKSWLRQLH